MTSGNGCSTITRPLSSEEGCEMKEFTLINHPKYPLIFLKLNESQGYNFTDIILHISSNEDTVYSSIGLSSIAVAILGKIAVIIKFITGIKK